MKGLFQFGRRQSRRALYLRGLDMSHVHGFRGVFLVELWKGKCYVFHQRDCELLVHKRHHDFDPGSLLCADLVSHEPVGLLLLRIRVAEQVHPLCEGYRVPLGRLDRVRNPLAVERQMCGKIALPGTEIYELRFRSAVRYSIVNKLYGL